MLTTTGRMSLLLFGIVAGASPSGAATCAFADRPKIAADTEIVLLAEGDSITAGVGSSDGQRSYVSQAMPGILRTSRVINKAVSQAVLGWDGPNAPQNSLYARIGSDNLTLPKDKEGKIYVLSLLIGRNDLVGYYGGLDQYFKMLQSYAATMREAGWDRIVLGTLLPSDWAPFASVRTDFNARVRTPCWAIEHGFDAIADFGADPKIGSDDAKTYATYFADGIHPNDTGYALMAPIYAQAINGLRR